MYDILNISDKYKVLYFNDKVKDSFMNMFLIGLDNSYLDIDMETLNNSSKYYRERLNKKFMNKFNKNFNLNNNRHLSYLSEVCGVDISIQNGDKMRETPRNSKKMLYFIKNDTGYGLVLKNNKKSYKTELLNTELPALEKLSIGGGNGKRSRNENRSRTDNNRPSRRRRNRQGSNNTLLERASIILDGYNINDTFNNNNLIILQFIKGFKDEVKEDSNYNIGKFDKELESLKQKDLIKANLIIKLKNNGKFTPKTIIEEAQREQEAHREQETLLEAQKARKAREALRTQGELQTSTQNLVNKEPTYKEGDVNFIDNKNSTINSINLLLRNDKDVNNLVVKIIQHTKLIKEMINHFISKLLEYKNKKEIIMSENIRQKLEEFKNSENSNIDIDYLYNLISRDLTLLYISNGFDTLKDFKSISNITREIYSYYPNLIWIEGLIALTVLYFSTFIIKYKYNNNDTNNNEYIIYLYENNITNENIETYMNNKYIYRFFQELVSPGFSTFNYLNTFFTKNTKEESSNKRSENRPYIGDLHRNKIFDKIKYNNILENKDNVDEIEESNKYNNIFNEMQQYFFNNIATLKGATIELDRVSDEMIFSLLKKDDKYTNEQQYKDTTLLVNHDSNNKLEFNNLQLLDRDKESRVPYTLYHSKNYIFNNEHNYLSMSLLDKFFDSGNSSYDEISKIKNTKDIIIPKALSEKYNKYINDKTVELLQDVVGIENINYSNKKYIYTYFSPINEEEDDKFKVIIEGNNSTINNSINNINNINDIINANYESILNADNTKKLNICFKINDGMYVRLLSFKLVSGKVTIDNYNTISILTKNINKYPIMKKISEYTEEENTNDNEMTMRRNILVRLKYLGDYSQYYYAKILQDFIENEDNNENFYRWQEPKKSIQEMQANTNKKIYLELKTKYLLIILSTYALIEFNYGMNWFNEKDDAYFIKHNNNFETYDLSVNNKNYSNTNIDKILYIYEKNKEELSNFFYSNVVLKREYLRDYYIKCVGHINFITFVCSGYIFNHNLFTENKFPAYEKQFQSNKSEYSEYIKKIYLNCNNIIEKNFNFKVYNLENHLYENIDIGEESDHFINRMKSSVKDNILNEYRKKFILKIKSVDDTIINNVDYEYNITFENLFKLKLENPLLSGIVDMLINLNHLDNIQMNIDGSEQISKTDIESLCEYLNNQFNNDTINEYSTVNDLFKISYSDIFNNVYEINKNNNNYRLHDPTIVNLTKITPINIYYLVYRFKLLKDVDNSANPHKLIFIIKKNNQSKNNNTPYFKNIKHITIEDEHIKTVRFLMKNFINYQIIDLFRGKSSIKFKKSKEKYLLDNENDNEDNDNEDNDNEDNDNEQKPSNFEENYGKYYEELVKTFKKEGNYIENKLVNHDESCKLDEPKDCVESIRLTEDMKYNLIRDVNKENDKSKKTFRVVIDSIDNNLNTQAYLGGVAFTHKYSNNKFKIIEPQYDNNKVEIRRSRVPAPQTQSPQPLQPPSQKRERNTNSNMNRPARKKSSRRT